MSSSHGQIKNFGTGQYKVIGTRPIRHDGTDKVTGRAQYGADVTFPRMLYGQVLRSPHAHARIKNINTSKALAAPAVKEGSSLTADSVTDTETTPDWP